MPTLVCHCQRRHEKRLITAMCREARSGAVIKRSLRIALVDASAFAKPDAISIILTAPISVIFLIVTFVMWHFFNSTNITHGLARLLTWTCSLSQKTHSARSRGVPPWPPPPPLPPTPCFLDKAFKLSLLLVLVGAPLPPSPVNMRYTFASHSPNDSGSRL